MTSSPVFMVVAGEPSGDWIAAQVVSAVQKRVLDARWFGIGGDALRQAGVELVEHISQLSAIGPVDSVRTLPRWMNGWAALRELGKQQLPAAALLVDCHEVNIRLARALKADGVKVLQYMGPKVWAWRPERLALLKRRSDWVALGFEFEKKWYDDHGMNAEFVGHPLLDAPLPPTRESVRKKLHAVPSSKVIALLPGSRVSEISHHGEMLLQAGVRMLKDEMLPVFAPFGLSEDNAWCHKARSLGCVVWLDSVRELLPACDAALAASGTVTLEVALAGVPMLIFYKLAPVNFWFAKKFLNIPYIGLPNWIAGEKVVPEQLQDDVTPVSLYEAVRHLVTPLETLRQKQVLAQISAKMGTPGAAARVADRLLQLQSV